MQLNARNVIQGFGMQEEYEITDRDDKIRLHIVARTITAASDTETETQTK